MHPCSRGEVFSKESRVSISDYWPASLVHLDINVKETKALSNTLFSFGDTLRDARVDAYVDNQALVRAWQSQAARSSSFSDALKELSNTVLSLNLHLSVFFFFFFFFHIPSRENPADHPSRRFSPADSNLARHLWLRLQSHPCFGGSDGHSVDLMALESNAQSDGGGVILPHFTPYPTPLSSGVDFFGQDFSQSVSKPLLRSPYIFPPILLIVPVLRHLRTTQLPCTVVVPDVHPRRCWWPILSQSARFSLKLSCKGELGAILMPFKHG